MSIAKVPFIDLKRFENGFLESVSSKVQTALKEAHFVGGPEGASCKESLKHFTRAQHINLCANGTDALQLALRAAGIGKGHKVLIPNLTFWASCEAVINVGATPVAIDLERETLHLGKQKCIEAFEKYSADALMLVHLFGWATPETEEIREFCKSENKILIEDSAQAIGTSLNKKSLIGEAPIATTSFYPAKVLGASGDAGAVFSTDEKIIENSQILGDHGRTDHYFHGHVGWNSRIGMYECIFIEESLRHIKARIQSRKAVCETYRNELDISGFTPLSPASGVDENGYLAVALVDPGIRNNLIAHLKDKNVGYGTVYPSTVSEQPASAKYGVESCGGGNAKWATQSVINLPCFAYMTESEQSYVIDNVKSFFKTQTKVKSEKFS